MIEVHTEIEFKLKDQESIVSWVKQTIINEGKELGDLNIIFCDDAYLLKINQQYLEHDYYTDIITFNYNVENEVSGDLFISIERVEDNSKQLSVPFSFELNRVIIHGVLHLIGYNDKLPSEISEMRSKEDYYLNLLF